MSRDVPPGSGSTPIIMLHLRPTSDIDITKVRNDFDQGTVALLPFVDEQCLLESLSSVYSNLTPYEGESGRHTEVSQTLVTNDREYDYYYTIKAH